MSTRVERETMGAMEPRTCREAVLEAMRRLEERHGRMEFTVGEILREALKFGRWEPTTIQTHVSAHMCNGRAGSELERAAPGVYRRRRDSARHGDQPQRAKTPSVLLASSLSVPPADINPAVRRQNAGAGAAFEEHARNLLSTRWGIAFTKRDVTLTGGVVVKFDLVSPDGHVIGDAKTYKNLPSPSAKWSVIAEYVWLLQHTTAARRFLVFGNDSLVPSRWLRRFSALCRDVEFWFIEGDEIVDLKAELGALG